MSFDDDDLDLDDVEDAETIEGIGEAEEKIVAYLTKRQASLENEGHLQIKLSQKVKEGVSPVEDFSMGFDDEPKVMAREILDAATKHCETYTGTVRFTIRVKGQSKNLLFSLFKPHVLMKDHDGDPFDMDADELPTSQGHSAQQMRHNEVLVRELVRATRLNQDTTQQMIKTLNADNERLRAQQISTRREAEELLDMSFRRRLDVEEIQEKKELKKQITGLILGIGVPLLAAKATGASLDPNTIMQIVTGALNPPPDGADGSVRAPSPIPPTDPIPAPSQVTAGPPVVHAASPVMAGMPGGLNETDYMIEGLISTFTEEQFKAFIANLTPEQQQRFFQIYQSIQMKKAAAPPPPPPVNGRVVEGSFEPERG